MCKALEQSPAAINQLYVMVIEQYLTSRMSDGTGEDSYQEKTGINVTKSLPVRFSTLQGGSRDQPYKPGQSGKFVVNHPISILPNHLKVSSKIFSDDKLVSQYKCNFNPCTFTMKS